METGFHCSTGALPCQEVLQTILSRRDQLVALLIGVAVGIVAGFTGVGGGALIVPLLVGLLGLTQHRAHGTSLAVVTFSAAASAIPYALAGNTDVVTAAELAVGSIVGVIIGAQWMPRIPAAQLRRGFGLFLAFLAVRLLLPVPAAAALGPQSPAAALAWNAAAGLVIGVIGGILGIGGGGMIVPAMIFMWGLGQHMAQGISLLAIVPTGIAGAASHHSRGNVAWRFVPLLAAGSIAGAVASASVANQVDTGLLQADICRVPDRDERPDAAVSPAEPRERLTTGTASVCRDTRGCGRMSLVAEYERPCVLPHHVTYGIISVF